MQSRTVLYRWVGINAILVSGFIHLYHAPAEFQDAPYISILFYVHFVGTLISTVGISWGGRLWGWALGGFLSAGALVDYLFSRTVGLPSIGVESWGPPLAYIAIILELIFFIPFLASYSVNLERAN